MYLFIGRGRQPLATSFFHSTANFYIKGPPEYCQDGTVTHLNYNSRL